jgi:hypothetical protein
MSAGRQRSPLAPEEGPAFCHFERSEKSPDSPPEEGPAFCHFERSEKSPDSPVPFGRGGGGEGSYSPPLATAVAFWLLASACPALAQEANETEEDTESKQPPETEETPDAGSDTPGQPSEPAPDEEPEAVEAEEEPASEKEQQPQAEKETVDDTGDESADTKPSGDAVSSDDEDLFAEMGSFEDEAVGESSGTDRTGPTGARLHGSLENQLTGLWLRRPGRKNRLSPNDYTRLRVDVDADLPQGVEVRADAVGRLFVGETEFDLRDLIPGKTFDDLIARDVGWAGMVNAGAFTYQLENELYIDNAYLKIPAGPLLFSLGKQPLEQGAGYVWNPTDVFIEKDMFDPIYEKEGVVSLRAMIPLGEIASLDLAVAPENDFEKWTGGGRARLRLGPLTFGPAAYLTRVERTDLEGSLDEMEAAATLGGDPEQAIRVANARRVMVGGDAVLDVEGVRLWTEGAHNFVGDEQGAPDDWWELSAGLEYFFSFETHLMVEYFHYGRGPEQRSATYSLNDWMGALATELRVLGRDLIFVSEDHPFADFWTVGLASIASFSDGSAAVMADVRWDFIQDGEIWLLVAGSVGEPEDFLSSGIGQGWLRVKVYF